MISAFLLFKRRSPSEIIVQRSISLCTLFVKYLILAFLAGPADQVGKLDFWGIPREHRERAGVIDREPNFRETGEPKESKPCP